MNFLKTANKTNLICKNLNWTMYEERRKEISLVEFPQYYDMLLSVAKQEDEKEQQTQSFLQYNIA